MIKPVFAILGLSLLLSSCATPPTLQERRNTADSLARQRDWVRLTLDAGPFQLAAFVLAKPLPSTHLTIYVEGDGLAWLSSTQASSDPTPRDPMGLRLALAQPVGAAVYLARPCQYVGPDSRGCARRYWTDARFAPEVIDATDRAVTQLKNQFGAQHVTLVGYSGGGAVAALVAARRSDTDMLVTVAGNLDHRAWTALQRISPLSASLNAADYVGALGSLPQLHFAGARDDNIPPVLAENFAKRFGTSLPPVVRIEPDFDHTCCWAQAWPRLYLQIRAQTRADQ